MNSLMHRFVLGSAIVFGSGLFSAVQEIESGQKVLSQEQPLEGIAIQETQVWASREQCEKVITEGGRMVPVTSSTLRMGTWNLRWFPSGKPDSPSKDDTPPTDLEWLVCTIIWMRVDILAVQESLATPEAQQAWNTVIRLLQKESGDPWRWMPQACGRPDDHHIGYLWNAGRVTLSRLHSLWQFNVKAKSARDPCKGGLRPGHYAWVQSRDKEGVDFHVIALHLKSGPTVSAVEDRHRALNRLDEAATRLLEQDRDMVILGDFNTMGAGDRASQRHELKSVRRQVANEKPGFLDLPAAPQCTHYFGGQGSWLDHVLVTKDMQEIAEVSAKVTGYCAVADCKPIKGDYPLAYRRLSDHCPVIIEIRNKDED